MNNIYQRISAVMQEVEYLAKDDKVSTGSSSYMAVTEEKVTTAVRAAMIKHGIVIIPIEQEHSRTDEIVKGYDSTNKRETERRNRIATVDTKYRIQNIDDPSDYVIAASSGTGVDTQDKGVGKAMTYAFKYLLLRTFAIPTGEDPDKVSSDLYTEKLTGGKPKVAPPPSNVYDDKINMQRKEIKRLVPDETTREAACQKRFNKSFMQLGENELSEIMIALQARTEAKATVRDTV